jgi:hypothetical protein
LGEVSNRTCPRSGSSFKQRDRRQVYCSKTCRTGASRTRNPDSGRSLRSYQRWTCRRKELEFPTEAEALAAMADINASPDNRLTEPLCCAYQCPFGDHWHLSHKAAEHAVEGSPS